jgi:hypothetical protein
MGVVSIRYVLGVALVCLSASSLSVQSAQARGVPADFFGVTADGPTFDGQADMASEFRLMHSSGARSVRLAVYWPGIEPSRGDFNVTQLDARFAAAQAAGLNVLPVVEGTPAWAASPPVTSASPPADPGDYAKIVARLARRYGPGGTFWTSRFGKAMPVKAWQIWNEPDLPKFWALDHGPWAVGYVRLLRAARKSLKAVDPKAKIVLAGMTNYSWRSLRSIYSAGGRGQFDLAAIHPFSKEVAGTLQIVRLARKAMAAGKDSKTPLLLTEVSWTSGLGQATYVYGWEASEEGQASKLRAALTQFAARRRSDNLAGLYWATWLSPKVGSAFSFDYSGLRKMSGGIPVSKPALAAYRRTVAKLTR